MVTELRVHGVTGTPAQDMLDRPLLRRVAGDGNAGFFRPRVEYGATTGPGGASLEAYRWGNLTAGAASRALWLMMLPFMLANVAYWLRPPSGERTKNFVRAVSRIFALTVTATFVLAVAGVSVDLVGWQCGGSAACTRGRPYFSLLAHGFFAPTGRRLALLALVPILVIGFLWFLGRRTWSRYEAYPVTTSGDGEGLAHPCFWNGKPLVGRLRAIHVAFGYATLDALLLGVLVPHDRTRLGYVLAGAVGLLLLICLVAVCLKWMVHRDKPGRGAHSCVWTLTGMVLLLTAGTLTYAMLPREAWPVGGGLPGFGMTITVLFAVQMALLVVLALVALLVRPKGTFLGGQAGPMVASLGLGIAVAASAGASYRVADFLNRQGLPASADYSGAPQPLEPPPSYEWASLGFVLLLLVVAIVALFARTMLMRKLRRYGKVVTDADFRGCRAADAKRAKDIDVAIADALISDHVGRLLAWVYVPSALAAVVITGLAIAGFRPVRLVPAGSPAAQVLAVTISAGTYLIGFAALALIFVGVLAYRYQRFRRVVGVLWDLGTFWPRAAHPLAPPCYAERVVPELAKRSTWLATERGGVILSGHSQGSVLAAATVLQMPPEARSGAALLTYGSPIRRLYVRLFPAYWDDAVLGRVGDAVADPVQHTPRWVNLWRDTDPIGGPVAAPAHDVRLVDPSGFAFAPGDSAFPDVEGHSNYPLHPMFGEAVSALVLGLPEARPNGSQPVRPPQPEHQPAG